MATGNNQDAGMVGWTSEPARRGTMGIIWSCLSVLVLCSYQCLHLDLYDRKGLSASWHEISGIPSWPRQALLRRILIKLGWIITVIIAPEIGVGLAISQYMAAQEILRRALEQPGIRQDMREKITLAHAFYAIMGGFGRFEPGGIRRSRREGYRATARVSTLDNYVRFLQNASDDEYNLSFISQDDLGNLSKSDGLTKALAITQSACLVAQSVARVMEGLPISLLELSTMSYVLCAVVMYGAWWHKPYDVEHITLYRSTDNDQGPIDPTTRDTLTGNLTTTIPLESMPLNVLRPAHDQDHVSLRASNTAEVSGSSPVLKGILKAHLENMHSWHFIEVHMFDFSRGQRRRSSTTPLVVRLVALLIAGIHLIAWSWDFPSPVAQLLWRIFVLGLGITGLVIVFENMLILLALPVADSPPQSLRMTDLPRLPQWMLNRPRLLGWMTDHPRLLELFNRLNSLGFKSLFSCVRCLSTILMLLYVALRLGIIVLTIYSLSSMPNGVYETVQWANYFPSIS